MKRPDFVDILKICLSIFSGVKGLLRTTRVQNKKARDGVITLFFNTPSHWVHIELSTGTTLTLYASVF
jgi:hypothetical protein